MAALGIRLLLLALASGTVVDQTYAGRISKRESSPAQQPTARVFPGAVAKDFTPSKSVLGKFSKQAVAADTGECSDMGNEILNQGGNAIDAAITTALCVGVYDPHSCGIGGGHFMVIYNRQDQNTTSINAREMAPKASTELMYADSKNLSSVKGWHAPGVPGEVAGLWAAYEYSQSIGGKVPWKDLFAPVIKVLREGMRVNDRLADAIRDAKNDILGGYDKGLTALFTKNKKLLVEGDMYINKELANTMEIIANDPKGTAEFYSGKIAKKLAKDFKAGGGIVTEEDLKNYKVITKPAIHTQLSDNSTLYTVPPPAGGLIMQYIVKVMDGFYGNGTLDWHKAKQAERDLFNQRLAETMKFAYARRAELGDEDFQPEVLQIEQVLLTPWYADLTRRMINEKKTSNDTGTYGLTAAKPIGKTGTSHLCVLDKEGNAVSLTTTINTHFGSRRLSPSTGILMNNQMDDFSIPNEPNFYGLPPSRTNYVVPGKRPQSSISGTIVVDPSGDAKLVIGGSGGSRIISSTATTLIRTLFLNLNIKEAIDHPRLHHQLLPMHLEYEPGTRLADLKSLAKKGHGLDTSHINETPYAVVQGIHRLADGSLEANSDHRKSGRPAGA